MLSSAHLASVAEVIAGVEVARLGQVPVVADGIIPLEDAQALRQAGAAAIYTPKNYDRNAILEEIVDIVEKAAAG